MELSWDKGMSPELVITNHDKFAEYGANSDQCSLFPAVRDLLANLTLPSEPPPMMGAPGPGVNMGVQVVGSPAAMAMQSPLQIHHSPLTPGAMGNPGGQPPGPPQQHPVYAPPPPPPGGAQQGSPMLNPHSMMPQ